MTRKLRENCPAIPEQESLYRTGRPPKKFSNPDGTATSRTFALREIDEGELSVDVVSMTTPEKSVTKDGKHEFGKFMLYQISVKSVNELSLSAHYDPLTLEQHGYDNPAHGFIWGLEDDDETLPGLLARKSTRIKGLDY